MCGIVGYTGAEREGVLANMMQSIVHRGPDEDGFYSKDRLHMGMRRLSIIDVQSGHQPVTNEDGDIHVVFNGEIYNFQALREDLEKRGHRFYTHHSDTEVIVHLYEEYGLDFAHHMNGMFAISIWDTREDRLHLVRDRMGVKPLFYHLKAGELIFASEIKAILKHPDYKKEPDHEGLYHFFTYKNVPNPFTAFKGIRCLRPGEMLTFKKGEEPRFKRWWKLQYREDESISEADHQKRILELLDEATQRRMVSDVPIGAYLSGGVDSSSIVALMARHSSGPVKTFCLGYDDELKNKEADLYHARRVSEHYKTDHHEHIMSYRELVDDIEKVITSFDQPFSGTVSTYFLSKLITKHVKVALSGDGADELFGSYLSHRVQRPYNYFLSVYDRWKNGDLTDEERKNFRPIDEDFLKRCHDNAEGDEARLRYQLFFMLDEDKASLLTPQFHESCGQAKTLAHLREQFKNLSAVDPLNRILEMEWNTQLPDQILAFVDFLSMAHSVEVRSPFLDVNFVEYAATIPGHLKIQGDRVKAILKDSVKPILPDGIIDRPKEGFVLPIFDWMVEKLDGYAENLLSESKLKSIGLLDADKVKATLEAYHSGDRSLPGRIWSLMMFQLWWDTYF